jgi:hypothetical protein
MTKVCNLRFKFGVLSAAIDEQGIVRCYDPIAGYWRDAEFIGATKRQIAYVHAKARI